MDHKDVDKKCVFSEKKWEWASHLQVKDDRPRAGECLVTARYTLHSD